MVSVNSKKNVVVLGRWQPVHNGHQAALHALCRQFNFVNIGIGSSNIHNYRNPFTLYEVIDMLNLTLKFFNNFAFTPVPDSPDPQEWCASVQRKFNDSELFVTANPYVKHLLGKFYPIKHPVSFIPEEEKIEVSATAVRKKMALGNKWQEFVPSEISDYIITRKLDTRFRKEFGLQTLSMEIIIVK